MTRTEIFSSEATGLFSAHISSVSSKVAAFLHAEMEQGRQAVYAKVFLSDAQNQMKELAASCLFLDVLPTDATTVVEQPPLDGSKISVLVVTDSVKDSAVFLSLRLSEEEAQGLDSYQQTRLLFDKYLDFISEKGLSLAVHCVRTWIYVTDIDVNYAGVVKARNDVFDGYGLTKDTHFIASTGIGGATAVRSACVAIDFLTYPDIEEGNKKYLKALDHLNPTHEYGVAFERATLLERADRNFVFVSGTASIDSCGKVVYEGDVMSQTERLLENIDALLADGDMSLANANEFVVYLRDVADSVPVSNYMKKRFPTTPFVIVSARVCRPGWLIEMECVAEKEK